MQSSPEAAQLTLLELIVGALLASGRTPAGRWRDGDSVIGLATVQQTPHGICATVCEVSTKGSATEHLRGQRADATMHLPGEPAAS